jgi:hypothetical protein
LLNLKKKIQSELKFPDINSFTLFIDNEKGQVISMQDNMKLKMIKNIADGTIIWVKEKPSTTRPTSHLASKPQPPSTALSETFADLVHNPKCQHGP